MDELRRIMERFAGSGWDQITEPARQWLDGTGDRETLIQAITVADKECENCGCELDPLYKRALELL